MKTWREFITHMMQEHGDSWEEVESAVGDLDVPFDDGYGLPNGSAFTVWTRTRVYFPVVYDGAEWVGSVARHPDGQPTMHVGSY
jgi:hypothetical protein